MGFQKRISFSNNNCLHRVKTFSCKC